MVKTIKISDENYVWLTKIAGKLQHENGHLVSIDAALTSLHKSRNITELAGSWKESEKQISGTTKELKDRWKLWRLRYIPQKAELKKQG